MRSACRPNCRFGMPVSTGVADAGALPPPAANAADVATTRDKKSRRPCLLMGRIYPRPAHSNGVRKQTGFTVRVPLLARRLVCDTREEAVDRGEDAAHDKDENRDDVAEVLLHARVGRRLEMA